MVKTKAADPPRVGGLRNGGLKSKSLKHLKFTLPPKRLVLCFWGARGPQKPRQEKNASVWQAKIKAAKILKHEPTCNAGGTQSPLKAGSVGDLKENKKPSF